MILRGTAIVLGNDVNTDLLHPPAFFSTDCAQAAAGAFAGLGLDLTRLGLPPYVIIAGRNFGCGSSRESTVRALSRVGVSAVVAVSFAHIFFRNAINRGIWPFVLADAQRPQAKSGDAVEIDTVAATLICRSAPGPSTWLGTGCPGSKAAPASSLCGSVRPAPGPFPLRPPEPYEARVAAAGGLVPLLDSTGWEWKFQT